MFSNREGTHDDSHDTASYVTMTNGVRLRMMNLTYKVNIECQNEKIRGIILNVRTHASEGGVLRQYRILRGSFRRLIVLKMKSIISKSDKS